METITGGGVAVIRLRFVSLGGSITTGYAAPLPAEGGWSALVALNLRNRFGDGFEYRNRGASGTDTAWGSLRVGDHAAGADLVVLEFAINDQWLDPTLRRQTFEGVLRQVLCLASRPRVLCLFLHERGNYDQGQRREQSVIADFYGVPWVAPDLSARPECWNPEDPIHPNARGHQAIASAVLEALESVLTRPSPAPLRATDLPDPLYSSDWQFVRAWDSKDPIVASRGWQMGSDVHPEWQTHGAALRGWSASENGAELVLEGHGTSLGILYSESEHYRNVVANLGGETVVLEEARPDRRGYLGWAYRALGRGLGEGLHRVTVRPAEGAEGRGKACHVVALVAAGVTETGRRFDPGWDGLGPGRAPGDLPLTWTGRFDPLSLPGASFGWQLTRLSGRFTGPRLGLEFNAARERNLIAVIVDGRCRVLGLPEGGGAFTVADDLGPGEHRLEVVKRSEGLFGTAVLSGLALAPGESWLAAPTRLPWRLEFYGDSITAGACNEDGAVDQYDDLNSHNALLSYPAITARRLHAEVVNLAVSGIGLTCSWNPLLVRDIWNRAAPSSTAPVVEADRAPHVVVVNLGQNDHGFPQSQGRGLDPEYGPRLVALVQDLRQRYPEAWIVGALGGMTGWKECAELRRLWSEAWTALQAADGKVRWFFFQAASSAHPRVDVHALLAEELTVFLTREVWPHLEASPH